jgi:hypothetical protein
VEQFREAPDLRVGNFTTSFIVVVKRVKVLIKNIFIIAQVVKLVDIPA